MHDILFADDRGDRVENKCLPQCIGRRSDAELRRDGREDLDIVRACCCTMRKRCSGCLVCSAKEYTKQIAACDRRIAVDADCQKSWRRGIDIPQNILTCEMLIELHKRRFRAIELDRDRHAHHVLARCKWRLNAICSTELVTGHRRIEFGATYSVQ